MTNVLKTALLVLLVLEATELNAQELVVPVELGKAGRLAEYNAGFLQKALYSAKRYRIVRLNVEPLFSDNDITLTPFDDVNPLQITQESVSRSDDAIYWNGRIQTDLQLELDRFGVKVLTLIGAHAWDLDAAGNASLSLLNRPKHSPQWKINDDGIPVLESSGAKGGSSIAGPPPETPEDIARQKRLQALSKRAFYSVSANIELPGGPKYILLPLELTPKYSVIYEVDLEKAIHPLFEPLHPGEADPRSDAEKQAFDRYRAFVDQLPATDAQPVKGDIE